MICFDTNKGRFNFRSVAVIINEGHILIHQAVGDDFWALPGGRVELFERSSDTVVREVFEELGLQCEVRRQLWHVENFFEYDSRRFHELANYFLVNLLERPIIETCVDFNGIEESVDLVFRWVPIALIHNYNLKPEFLIERLNTLPASIEIVTVDEINI